MPTDEVATPETSGDASATVDNPDAATPVRDEMTAMREAAATAIAASAKAKADAKSVADAADLPPADSAEGEAKKSEPAATQAATQAPASKKLRDILARKEVEQRAREEVDRGRIETQKAREELEREKQAILADRAKLERIKVDPIGAIRELGLDAQGLLKQLVAHSGPEGELHRKIAELETQLHKPNQAPDKVKELEERIARYEQGQAQERHAAQQRTFLALCAEEKAPFLRSVCESDAAVIARAQKVADEYCAKTGETYCPFEDLRDYLEEEAKTAAAEELKRAEARVVKLSKLLKELPGVQGQSSTESNGRAPTKPRTLGAESTGERRASPKAPATEAEIDEAMRAAARTHLQSARRP